MRLRCRAHLISCALGAAIRVHCFLANVQLPSDGNIGVCSRARSCSTSVSRAVNSLNRFQMVLARFGLSDRFESADGSKGRAA